MCCKFGIKIGTGLQIGTARFGCVCVMGSELVIGLVKKLFKNIGSCAG